MDEVHCTAADGFVSETQRLLLCIQYDKEEGQYWADRAALDGQSCAHRLASGRAHCTAHWSGQGGGYRVIISGQRTKNVRFVIVNANT